MSSPDQAGGRGRSDGELLARWLDEASDDIGVASVAVFICYRDTVRSELERLGLSPLHAVQKVGSVFHKAQQNRVDLARLPLRERLTTVAREIVKPAQEQDE